MMPTNTSTGVVAALGIAMKNGAINSASKKQNPVTKAVMPLRPPALTPVALSMYVMTALVPIIDPNITANEPTLNILRNEKLLIDDWGICELRPIIVPSVPNKSTKRIDTSTINISTVKVLLQSISKNMGSMLGGVLTKPSIRVSPIGIPITAVNRIPSKRAPGTFFMNNTAVRIIPIIANNGDAEDKSPSFINVEESLTTTPAFFNPIKIINIPMPEAIEVFKLSGMAPAILSQRLKIVSRRNTIPSRKTAVRAKCHEYPIMRHTVYVNIAFMPIPGASANGSLAIKAMRNVAIAAERAVVVNSAPLSIPVSASIAG